jgi:UDP-N-acetylmuramyl tripeptide synthase
VTRPSAQRSKRAHELRGRVARVRAAVAVVAGRAAGASARRLRLGAGTSLPGLVASRLDPRIVAHLGAQLRHGSVLVTGTNGKTTTSGLVAYMLRDAGLRVWRNREGANLLRGVSAALVIRATPSGRLRREGNAAAVFEVDEAAFPQVLAELRPRAVVVTNLFRDQLDRYGEVDTVAERWRTALATAPATTARVLNADDPAVAALGDGAPGNTLYFGVEDVADPPNAQRHSSGEVIDTRTCPRCHAPLEYSLRFYSHVGHWACLACGYARPIPAIRARAVQTGALDAVHFRLETPDGAAEVTLRLPGLYNVYNALAAAAASHVLGVSVAAARTGIERFTPAFGRAERIAVDGREVRLLLAKNPTGLNEVLRALAGAEHEGAALARRHFFLLLNDHAADGEDVSWIWDADFERVAGLAESVVVSGTRAADLAVRLKYAGVGGNTHVAVEPNVPRALDLALANVPAGGALDIVPTYTAMLAVRGELERRGFAPHYWETADA